MKIAITGATGFIGRAVSRELAQQGHSILALTRRPEAVAGGLGPGVEAVKWDAFSPAPLPPCDAVVHLAGESVAGRWTPAKKARIRDSRIQGTRALVDGIARMPEKPSVLVSASAVGYYGDRGDEILTESSPPGHDFLAEVCAGWEAEAERAESLSLRVARVRLGIVLGRDGGALPMMALPFRFGLGGRLGSGRQWVSWIHREDAVGLFLHALERAEVSGPVNASAPEPVTNADLTRALAKALRRPAILPVPGFALKLAVGEMAGSLLGGQRALPDAALKSGYTFRYPDLAVALDEIYGLSGQ
jgi:uncharacterized protein (TIGR01777 family)